MGLKNRGEMKEVGVHAADLDSLSGGAAVVVAVGGRGERWPVGVRISGVEVARGVAGIEMSSVSGLSSIVGCVCLVGMK